MKTLATITLALTLSAAIIASAQAEPLLQNGINAPVEQSIIERKRKHKTPALIETPSLDESATLERRHKKH